MNNLVSPCVRHCQLDNADICIGCFRSLTEIMHWREASDVQKSQILSRVEQRQRSNKNAIKANNETFY